MRSTLSGYPTAVFWALLIHLGVLGLFLVELPSEKNITIKSEPANIKATLVVVENSASVARAQKEKQQQQDAKRRVAEARKRAEIEKKKAEEKIKEQLRLKKQAEIEKKKQLEEKQKNEKERLRKEREAELAKLAEESWLKELKEKEIKKQELKRQEEAMLEAVQAEDKKLNEQEEARREAEEEGVVLERTELIRKRITEVWVYPPNVKRNQEVTLKISLVPTGQVITVTIIKGSGNAALDRSVEQAVYKASPLPVPDDIVVFEKHFRNFTILFRPENASW